MKRLDYDDVKQYFIDKNYILVSKKYVNNHQKLEYICPNHSDKILTIEFADLKRGHGCKYCGNEQKSITMKNKNR
jgi:hypothetical protein